MKRNKKETKAVPVVKQLARSMSKKEMEAVTGGDCGTSKTDSLPGDETLPPLHVDPIV